MYSVEEIKELLSAFDTSKATILEIKSADGEKLTIAQKNDENNIIMSAPAASVPAPMAMPVPVPQCTETKQSSSPFIQPEDNIQSDDGSKPITSPMVGVFYAAPSPDKEPYVTVGSKVKKGDVLCLIEAMKLMNEVTAEQSGEIVKICVDNEQVVEYGQPLFMIK